MAPFVTSSRLAGRGGSRRAGGAPPRRGRGGPPPSRCPMGEGRSGAGAGTTRAGATARREGHEGRTVAFVPDECPQRVLLPRAREASRRVDGDHAERRYERDHQTGSEADPLDLLAQGEARATMSRPAVSIASPAPSSGRANSGTSTSPIVSPTESTATPTVPKVALSCVSWPTVSAARTPTTIQASTHIATKASRSRTLRPLGMVSIGGEPPGKRGPHCPRRPS